MNQQQLKYARERAKTIYDRRNAALKELHTVKAVLLSFPQRVAALKEGKFKVVPPRNKWRENISECIQFLDEKPEDRTAYDKALNKLSAEYERIMDELVLGDSEVALSLLRTFDKG